VTRTNAQGSAPREVEQAIHYRPKPPEQFVVSISTPESIKLLGLFLKNAKDGFGAVAVVESGRKWMLAEVCLSLSGIFVQGGIDEIFEVGGRGGCV
jgi:hypothetical protein